MSETTRLAVAIKAIEREIEDAVTPYSKSRQDSLRGFCTWVVYGGAKPSPRSALYIRTIVTRAVELGIEHAYGDRELPEAITAIKDRLKELNAL